MGKGIEEWGWARWVIPMGYIVDSWMQQCISISQYAAQRFVITHGVRGFDFAH